MGKCSTRLIVCQDCARVHIRAELGDEHTSDAAATPHDRRHESSQHVTIDRKIPIFAVKKFSKCFWCLRTGFCKTLSNRDVAGPFESV